MTAEQIGRDVRINWQAFFDLFVQVFFGKAVLRSE